MAFVFVAFAVAHRQKGVRQGRKMLCTKGTGSAVPDKSRMDESSSPWGRFLSFLTITRSEVAEKMYLSGLNRLRKNQFLLKGTGFSPYV